MYAAAFSPCVTTRRMSRSSMAAMDGSMIVGTKKRCVTPYPRIACAKNWSPVIRAILPLLTGLSRSRGHAVGSAPQLAARGAQRRVVEQVLEADILQADLQVHALRLAI